MKGGKQVDSGIRELIEQSSLAIALHNFHKSYCGDNFYKVLRSNLEPEYSTPALDMGPLEIKNYPLAFLLSFCDTAQERGRPSRTGYNDKVSYAFDEILVDPHKTPGKTNVDSRVEPNVSIRLKVNIPRGANSNEVHNKLEEENEHLLCAWKSEKVIYWIHHVM